jgi:hypothetical protein
MFFSTILLAATSKSPIKAATTDVREDDFLRLNVARFSRKIWGLLKGSLRFSSLRKRGMIEG